MRLILNEKEYIKKTIIEPMSKGEKLNIKKPYSELPILAKYYYYIEKLSDEKITNKLNDFMMKNSPKFNRVKSENTIEGIVNSCKKIPLIKLDYIPITQKELDIIKTIKDERLEKYLFGLLCYAKAYSLLFEENNGWINTELSIIYKSCRLRSNDKDDRFMLIHKLLNIEYNGNPIISLSKKNTNRNVKINFIDINGKEVLKIYDSGLKELGYEYMNYLGIEKFIRCQECGKLVKIKNKNDGSSKYCNECARKKELEKYQKYNEKRKNNHQG